MNLSLQREKDIARGEDQYRRPLINRGALSLISKPLSHNVRNWLTGSKRYTGTSTTATNALSGHGITYDANGNTTHDGRTGQDLSWNMLNLISGVSATSGGSTTQLASYNWFADGSKNSELCARKLSPATSLL